MKRAAFVGATAIEVQFGPVWARFCYLLGGRWKWYTPPWRRLIVGIDRT